jgi:hypothetical protein
MMETIYCKEIKREGRRVSLFDECDKSEARFKVVFEAEKLCEIYKVTFVKEVFIMGLKNNVELIREAK